MAGQVPKEEKSSAPPGAFPETPAPDDNQTFSVNPIPASGGIGNPIQLAPGEKVPDPSTINDNTVSSTARTDTELKSKDEGEQTFSVAPIPATGGIGNPIQLAPGEKVPDPSTLTSNTVDSTAKTGEAAYQKSDAGVSSNKPETQTEITPAQAFVGGPGPVLPESGMSNNTQDISNENVGPTVSSVGPQSTTNDLAGQVPKEPRGVAEVVSEDKTDSTEEKKDESGIAANAAAGVAAAGVGAAGVAVAANEFIKDKTNTDPKSQLPESAQNAIDEKAKESAIPQQASTTTTTDAARETTSTVPEQVTESQQQAGQDAEAAANTEAVKEKAEVESELLKKVPESEAQGEPAPTDSAAAATSAPAATTTSSTGAPQLEDPTAGVGPISMDDSALNASKDSEAQAPADKAEEQKPLDSRDISPMSKQPTATTGVASAAIPRNNGASSSTPQKRQSFVDKLKGTPESSKTASDKKEKRRSFFGKLKDKLKS
jgi:hypothetical protein